jgi:hypothetical protein
MMMGGGGWVRRGKSVVWDECCRLDDREGIYPARFSPSSTSFITPRTRGCVANQSTVIG